MICLTSADRLDIVKTFECGQCFRWNADANGVYHGFAGKYPADVFEKNGSVFVDSDAPDGFWYRYFDLDTEYDTAPFMTIPYLKTCTEYGQGIRILRQDPFEALISFIISQCNNIPRIKGIIEKLCGGDNPFPSPDQLKDADLGYLHAGYRAPYINAAAREVSEGTLNLKELVNADAAGAKKRLLELNGVGEKVANCVVLFGLHHLEAFPVDVWIRRALTEHFPPDFSPETLGPYAGVAQQYIFYYTRENGTKRQE